LSAFETCNTTAQNKADRQEGSRLDLRIPSCLSDSGDGHERPLRVSHPARARHLSQSVAAVPVERCRRPEPAIFGLPWWKRREWAKTDLTESEKTLWWELFDRWRK